MAKPVNTLRLALVAMLAFLALPSVSVRVGNVKNNDPSLIEPIAGMG
jgi:hypothetical protein